MMSDLFIRLLEKLFELQKLIQGRQLDRLKEVIEPIFSDMQEIHNAYLDNLSQAKQYLRDADIEQAVDFLEMERVELRPLRTNMQLLIGQLSLNPDLVKYQKLLAAMEHYLDPRPSRPILVEIMGLMASIKSKGAAQGRDYTKLVSDLIRDIGYMTEELESSWENIVQEYSRLIETR
jgi:hypothetical protein